MTTNLLRQKIRHQGSFDNLLKVATTLNILFKQMTDEINEQLPKLWLHLEKNGIFTLRDTDERRIDTLMVIRPPQIEISKISIEQNLMYLREDLCVTYEDQTWKSRIINIQDLSICQKYVKDRITVSSGYSDLPAHEIVNTEIYKLKRSKTFS